MDNNTTLLISPSSAIASAEYNSNTEKLTVNFHRGGSYSYDSVPQNIVEDLEASDSAGEFYQSNIRGQFQAENVG